jgi:hypothetical protein
VSTFRTRHTPEIGRSSAAVDADDRALAEVDGDADVAGEVVGAVIDVEDGAGDPGEGRPRHAATTSATRLEARELAIGPRRPADRPVIYPLW